MFSCCFDLMAEESKRCGGCGGLASAFLLLVWAESGTEDEER
jgi:hypothetical protein